MKLTMAVMLVSSIIFKIKKKCFDDCSERTVITHIKSEDIKINPFLFSIFLILPDVKHGTKIVKLSVCNIMSFI